MTDQQGPITVDEMIAMFGETMPIEAVNLIWDSPDGTTVGEVRQRLRDIAKNRKAAGSHMTDLREIVARALYRVANPFARGGEYDEDYEWSYHSDEVDAVFAAIDAAGWAVVPREPTEAMYLAAYPWFVSSRRNFKQMYRAMLATASQEQGR